jgi:hypothetical protein
MKKLILIFAAFIITLGLKAQSTADDIAIVQSLWGKGKRDIVKDYMKLASAEEAGFWQQYDAYEAARKDLGKERILLIEDYVKNYGTLTDPKATELVNKVVANNIAIEKLQLKTFKSMSKVVSPVKAAQFIQLERYFILAIQMSIQDELPFIGELDDLMKK